MVLGILEWRANVRWHAVSCVSSFRFGKPQLLTQNSLAMAEMTTLTATMYRQFRTTIAPGFEDTTPAITARVETFYDDRFPKVQVSLLFILITMTRD
jgi:hypothetical protein